MVDLGQKKVNSRLPFFMRQFFWGDRQGFFVLFNLQKSHAMSSNSPLPIPACRFQPHNKKPVYDSS